MKEQVLQLLVVRVPGWRRHWPWRVCWDWGSGGHTRNSTYSKLAMPPTPLRMLPPLSSLCPHEWCPLPSLHQGLLGIF